MSDKFDMKLVIDAVTTPLLHARLSQAGSARVRAALLRSLAEAALRGVAAVPMSLQQSGGNEANQAMGNRTAAQAKARSEPALPVSKEELPASQLGEIVPDNEVGDHIAHDVEQIADAFGGYF